MTGEPMTSEKAPGAKAPATLDRDGVLARFEQAAAAAGSIVHRATSLDAVGTLARSLAEGDAVLVTTAVAADERLVAALGAVVTTDEPAAAADRPVAVERGTLAIAETGSILVREPDRASRLASMLARTLIQVVAIDAVVASLDEAGAWLAAHAADGYAALVTGPSRTADIERVLTVGVQGPAELHVVLVESSEALGDDDA